GVDFPAPSAALDAAALDQLLEALEVTFDLARVDADRRTELLRDSLWLVGHLDRDQRLVLAERLELHAPVRPVLPGRPPGDLLVGHLLHDLGHPLAALAPDLGDPLEMRVVDLLHGLDA